MAAAVVLLAAAGCGGGDDSGSEDDAGSGGAGGASSSELTAALLTVSDMPAGWVDLGLPTPETCGMRSDMDPATSEELPSAAAAFAAAEGAAVPDVFEVVVEAPEGQGETIFDGIRRSIGQCAGEIDGVSVTGSEILQVPAVGDQFVSRRINAVVGGADVGIDLLYIRSGDRIVGLGVVEPPGDTARLVELSSLAFGRATTGG